MPTSLPAALRNVIRRAQPKPVRSAARNLWNEIRIARDVRRSSRQFRTLRDKKNLKVHLGCGTELKLGWVNLDLNLDGTVPTITPDMPPETIYINYDLRSGVLPLADGSCDVIYSSHFFEHLECEQGLTLMRDSYRALRPGGTFRAALPDFRRMFKAYLEDDREHLALVEISEVLPGLEKGTESFVDYVNYGVYQNGEHKCIYDEEKACLSLRHVGFSSAEPVPYREDLDPASELRRRYSFYVEARK